MLSFAIQYLYCPYVLSSPSNSYDLKDFCSYDLMYHCDHMFMSEASNSPSHVETSDNNCCFVINFSLFWCFAVSLHLKLLLFQAETRQTWSIDIILSFSQQNNFTSNSGEVLRHHIGLDFSKTSLVIKEVRIRKEERL